MTEEGNPLTASSGLSRKNMNGAKTSTSTSICRSTKQQQRSTCSNNNKTGFVIKSFPDPSTGDRRQYAVSSTSDGDNDSYGPCQILEFQSLESDFSSFLVGRHVVKDGSLYLINQVDPLFFFLATQQPQQEQQQQQWQPMDQFVASTNVPHEIQRALLHCTTSPPTINTTSSSPNYHHQLMHVCDSIADSDMIFLKFNPTKSLRWLQKKQEVVLKCLTDQHIEQTQTVNKKMKSATTTSSSNNNNNASTSTAKSSSSNTFNIPIQRELETEPTNTITTTTSSTSSETSTNSQSLKQSPSSSSSSSKRGGDSSSSGIQISESLEKQLKSDSIDIVCSYLNNEWSNAFMDHLGWKPSLSDSTCTTTTSSSSTMTKSLNRTVTPNDATNPYTNKSSSSSSSSAATFDNQKKNDKTTAQTAGNKRLAKIKTKGMKSISSFFGGGGGGSASKKAKNSTN